MLNDYFNKSWFREICVTNEYTCDIQIRVYNTLCIWRGEKAKANPIQNSVNSNIFEDIFKLGTVSQASPHCEIILVGGDGVQSSRLCYIYYLPISCKTQNYKLTINGHEWYVSSFDGFEFFFDIQPCRITFNEYWILGNARKFA